MNEDKDLNPNELTAIDMAFLSELLNLAQKFPEIIAKTETGCAIVLHIPTPGGITTSKDTQNIPSK